MHLSWAFCLRNIFSASPQKLPFLFSRTPRCLDYGSAYSGQILGLMMANLPEVGGAEAAGTLRHQLSLPYGPKQLFQLVSVPRCVRRDTGTLWGYAQALGS